MILVSISQRSFIKRITISAICSEENLFLELSHFFIIPILPAVIIEKEIIRMVKYEESTLNQGGLDLKFSGSLKPAVESMLSFKVSGTLEKINVNIGDKADIFVASVNQFMEGTVTEVGSTSTGFGGTYVIKLNLQGQNNKVLKSGMVVEIKLKTAEKEKYITLPLSAINQDSKGEKFVYTVEKINNGEGVVVKKSITIGKLINNRLEILSGIKENEKIITAGVSKVVPGQKVRLYEEVK